MRQPIKLLPYFGSAERGGCNIARFKGLSVNCSHLGESWELSAVPGKQSIVAEGDNAGMELNLLVESQKGNLVGEGIYSLYGDKFPLCLRLVDSDDRLTVEIHHQADESCPSFMYYPETGKGEYVEELKDNRYFSVAREEVNGERRISNPHDSFMGLLCLEGEGKLKVDGICTPVKKGETLLLPAPVNEFDVQGALTLLTVVALIPGVPSAV